MFRTSFFSGWAGTDSRRISGRAGNALRLLAVFGIAAPALADDSLIERRQGAFSELEERLERIEGRLDGGEVDWAALMENAERAQKLAQWLHGAFPADSAEGSRARERIWNNWSDFSSRLRRMSNAVDLLAAASVDQDPAAAATQLDAANDTCRSCHMRYRSLFSW